MTQLAAESTGQSIDSGSGASRPLPEVRRSRQPRRRTGLSVNTVPGVYLAVPVEALLQKVCIVPNYKLGGDNFLVNDFVNIASEDLMMP